MYICKTILLHHRPPALLLRVLPYQGQELSEFHWRRTQTASFKLKIGSLNVRGLGNRIKRRSIFNYLRDKKLDIIFLQETHSSRKTAELWQNEWCSKWLISSGSSNAKGTAILFNPKFKCDITKVLCDHDGRYVVCNLQKNNINYTICNVYAPNDDSPKFFHSLFKTIEKVATENVIIGGDFNLTLNPQIDRLDSKENSNNHQAAKFVNAFMEEFKLCDVWRDRNKGTKRYSWFKNGRISNLSASRIDFFLTSYGLSSKVTDAVITGTNKSDHSLITLEIDNIEVKRGPGIWRLNTKLLNNERFCSGNPNIANQVANLNGVSDINKWEKFKKDSKKLAQTISKEVSQKKSITSG